MPPGTGSVRAAAFHTFQHLRSDPGTCSVNAACLIGFDIWALPAIPVHDGRDNHPTDTGLPRQYVGTQRQDWVDT